MLWAACSLWSSPWILCSILAPNIKVSDFQADSLVNPTYFKFRSKCSKTDPFRVGCDVYLGQGVLLLVLPWHGVTYGPLVGLSLGHYWCLVMVGPYLAAAVIHSTCSPSYTLQVCFSGSYSGHSSRIGAASTIAAAGQKVQDHLINTLGSIVYCCLPALHPYSSQFDRSRFPTSSYCTYGTFGSYLEMDASGWAS